ncbi:unnamed protein product [Trichobilharzia szidati]|nr:unnamed protein product [Trichobilharzia szidati]
MRLHCVRFSARVFTWLQVCPHAFISSSHDLLQVTLGRPTRRFPFGFHSRACLVMSLAGFLRVWPIHLHFFLPICFTMGSWLVRSQRSLLLILSGHLILSIERRHLLMKVCSLFEVLFVTRQVSDPYSSTDFTLELKIPILFLTLNDVVLHTDFRVMKACLAFPILALISSSVPPVVETMLPK